MSREIIYFNILSKKLSQFSMTYEHLIVYKNIEYPTLRHLVYATRFDVLATLTQDGSIKGAKTVVASLDISKLRTLKEIPITNKNYHKEVLEVVKLGLKYIIDNDSTGDFLRELLETGSSALVYSAPFDTYWGSSIEKTGVNRLGLLLEEIREEYRKALT